MIGKEEAIGKCPPMFPTAAGQPPRIVNVTAVDDRPPPLRPLDAQGTELRPGDLVACRRYGRIGVGKVVQVRTRESVSEYGRYSGAASVVVSFTQSGVRARWDDRRAYQTRYVVRVR